MDHGDDYRIIQVYDHIEASMLRRGHVYISFNNKIQDNGGIVICIHCNVWCHMHALNTLYCNYDTLIKAISTMESIEASSSRATPLTMSTMDSTCMQ